MISDIHLGNKRNPTARKIALLRKAIPDDAVTAQLDYIWIAGDTYDDLLNHSSEEVIEIDFWIASLLRLCKKHHIKLRVLLGTRSHDYTQPKRFTAINHLAKIDADLQYIDDICVKVENGISILYVPDDMDRDTDRIFHVVKTKMMEQGLEQVDFAIMHGQFEHQLPEVVRAPKHNLEKYLSIVKHYIFIGHVHIHSVKDRAIAQGSFDRDRHGEELPKGHVRFEVNLTTNDRRCRFVVNKDAMIFKTLKIVQKDIDAVIDLLKKQIFGKIPDGSHVRLMAPKEHPIHANAKRIDSLFPLIRFTINQNVDENKPSPNLIDTLVTYKTVEITPSNVVELTMDKVKSLTQDPALLSLCKELMTALK